MNPRSAARLLSLAALFCAAASTPTPTTGSQKAIHPVDVTLNRIVIADLANPLPNAVRLALGMTPARPRMLNKRATRTRSRGSASPTPSPSPSHCSTVTGQILVDGLTQEAWVSRYPNSFGEYTATTSTDDALTVTYQACPGVSGVPLDLQTVNGIVDYPYLGGVVGFATTSDDFGTGSSNYAYLSGTNETPPNSPAQNVGNAFNAASGSSKDSESAIWSVDASGGVTAQWINTDHSEPPTTIVYVTSTAAFALTGDVDQFTADFGEATVVTLTLVSL